MEKAPVLKFALCMFAIWSPMGLAGVSLRREMLEKGIHAPTAMLSAESKNNAEDEIQVGKPVLLPGFIARRSSEDPCFAFNSRVDCRTNDDCQDIEYGRNYITCHCDEAPVGTGFDAEMFL